MRRTTLLFAAVAAAAAIAIACDRPPASPASPSVATSAGSSRNGADGSTLKVTAPAPQSPVNDAQVDMTPIPLVASTSSPKFTNGVSLQYRFQVLDAGGNIVADSGLVGGSAWNVSTVLGFKQRYTWRVRAEYQGQAGPWSSTASFISPVGGFLNANGLYDPLNNGKTLGQIHGPVTLIPGLGARLETLESYISYELPQTLTAGEFSLLVTNMPANTEGGKTKLFSMGQGYGDIVTNDRRFTIEKRGDPPGMVAWRMITHDDQIDTGAGERLIVDFKADRTYLWRATWGNGLFRLTIREGGPDGPRLYDMSRNYLGVYDPNPHVVYLGAPVGRSGADGASVQGAIIRQVWVSNLPRPASANQ